MTRGDGTTPPEQGVALAPGAATTFESVSSRPSGLGRLLGATALPTTAPRPPQTRQLRVVGVVILSSQGDAEIEPGEGALVESAAAMTGTTFPTNYLVRFRAGIDPDDAADRLRRDFFDSTAYPTFPPTIVRTVARVAYLPGVLAAVVVVLALGTLLHGLVVVLRRRRRDLAVMQAVGFSGRQVLGSVGVQATTIALVGLVAGIPLGLAIGRTGWRLTATELGVAAPPALPWLELTTISLLTVLAVTCSPSDRAGAPTAPASPRRSGPSSASQLRQPADGAMGPLPLPRRRHVSARLPGTIRTTSEAVTVSPAIPRRDRGQARRATSS